MSAWRAPLSSLLACALLGLAACAEEEVFKGPLPLTLAECDETAAIAPVFYDADGYPAYGGQALIQASCGNGVACHAPAAVEQDRWGAPAALDFDVRLACQTYESCESETERLALNRQNALDHGHPVYVYARRGTMPPRGTAAELIPELGYTTAEDVPLPALQSAEGAELLRNWLACGAPVVERTTLPPTGITEVGAIQTPIIRPPDPTWTSIWSRLLVPNCSVCHGGLDSTTEQNKLDMREKEAAYAALLGPSYGLECTGQGNQRVVPGDPDASLLIRKLQADSPNEVCGQPMPPRPIPKLAPKVVAPIRQWIADGAPDN